VVKILGNLGFCLLISLKKLLLLTHLREPVAAATVHFDCAAQESVNSLDTEFPHTASQCENFQQTSVLPSEYWAH